MLLLMTGCSYRPKTDGSAAANLPVDSLKALVYQWGAAPYDLPDSVIVYVDEFLQVSEAKRNYSDMVIAYKIQYFYYRKCNNFPEVYRSSLHRLDAAHLSGDSTQILDAIYALGRTLFLNGSYYESLDYFLQLDSRTCRATGVRLYSTPWGRSIQVRKQATITKS